MISNFNEEAQEILNKAKLEMLELRHPYVGTEHLVLSILRSNNEISEKLKKSKLFYMVLTLLGLSVFIGLFDAQGAGLLQRYVADYAYLAILAAILVVLFLYEHSRGPRKLSLNSFTAFSLYGSGIYCFFIIFAVYGTEIFYHNYTLFANVAQLIQFWK